MKHIICLLAMLLLFLCTGSEISFGVQQTSSAVSTKNKHILIITSQPYVTEWFTKLDNAFKRRLGSTFPGETKLSYEYIGPESMGDPEYVTTLLNLLQKKYARIKLDFLVGVMPTSCSFLLKNGEKAFPNVPKVYALPIKDQTEEILTQPKTALVESVSDIAGTIERIRALLPQTKHLFVVSGMGSDDLNYVKKTHDAVKSIGWPSEVTYLTGLPPQELAERLSNLPDYSAILMLVYLLDREKRPLTTVQVMQAISPHSNAPIFGFYDTVFGYGIVGGRLTSAEAYGEAIATAVSRLLAGEGALKPIIVPAEIRDIYDWRQLDRWKIPESRLPEGSIIRYRTISFWEANRDKVIFALIVFLVQAILIVILLVNLTKRRRAEKALRASEEKFRNIFENTVIGIYQSTPQGIYLSVNSALAHMCGFASPKEMTEEVTDIQRQMYANPEERTKFKKIISEEGIVKGFEAEYKRKDGTRVWVSINGKAIRDEKGNILYYDGTAEDITERKRMEKELQRYRQNLEELVRKRTADLNEAQAIAHLGNWVWEIPENRLSWSDEAYRIFGLDPQGFKVLYEGFRERTHPDDRARLQAAVDASLRDRRPFTMDHRIVRPDGTERIVHEHGEVTCDGSGKPIRMFGTIQDITERKRSEEALRESEERYRTLFEGSRDAVYITTREGKFADSNQAFSDLLGYNREEIVMLSARQFYANPSDRDRFQEEIEQKGFVRNFELTLRKKDGNEVDCLLTSTIRWSKDGGILGYQGIIHDITERKRAEEALARQNKELEILNEMKDRFLGIAAHDLRNPLAVVNASTKILQKGTSEIIRVTLLNNITRATQKMLALIDNLLDVSIIRSGKLELRSEDVDVYEFLKECYHSNEIIGNQKNIALTLSVPEGIGHARFDKERMHQAVDNLLSNAFKYSNPNTTVTLGARRSDRGLEIRVEDQGVGIKDEDLPLLFGEFSKASAQPTGGEPSHGLGLAIVKRVVELQGGRIDAKSNPGGGAVFSITLP